MTDTLNINDVQRLALHPDDVIVIRSEVRLSAEAQAGIAEQVRNTFPHNKCIVLDEGLDLMLVGPAYD